jgi:hypothetical protein
VATAHLGVGLVKEKKKRRRKMNEYTVNIPVEEYDKLRLCELQLKKSYTLELVKRAKELASLNIDRFEYADYITAQNRLMAFIHSNFFEFKEFLEEKEGEKFNQLE